MIVGCVVCKLSGCRGVFFLDAVAEDIYFRGFSVELIWSVLGVFL